MKANAVRFAAGLVFLAVGAPLPALRQFIYPPVFVVPPPAQDYGDATKAQAGARQAEARRPAHPGQGRAL